MQILFPSFGQEVVEVLNLNGIRYRIDGNAVLFPEHNLRMVLVPLEETATLSQATAPTSSIKAGPGPDEETFFLYEDRWRSTRTVTSQRMLSRLGLFRRIHARLCKVVSLQNCKEFGLSPEAFHAKVQKFLDAFHTYGYLRGQTDYLLMYKEDTVAAAQFRHTYYKTGMSVGQVPAANEQTIPNSKTAGMHPQQLCAYEWTRYASLPDVRIAGGMGKVLKHFLKDAGKINVIEVMSYSDNEWSNGDAYLKLGFKYSGCTEPITYHIDPKTCKRINPRQWADMQKRLAEQEIQSFMTIRNCGSKKWVLSIGDMTA